MTLGRAIQTVRFQGGIKQKDLAANAGITQKYLSEIENNHVDPRWKIVVQIGRALGVSLDTLSCDSSDSRTT